MLLLAHFRSFCSGGIFVLPESIVKMCTCFWRKEKIFAWPDFSLFSPFFLPICHYHTRQGFAHVVEVCSRYKGRYLCPTNPSVFCGRTAGFGDEGIAVNTAYLDISYIFYALSHSVFVFQLGHGLGGQNTGGWWLVLCSAWRPVAGWSCWGPRGTCCVQLAHRVPR